MRCQKKHHCTELHTLKNKNNNIPPKSTKNSRSKENVKTPSRCYKRLIFTIINLGPKSCLQKHVLRISLQPKIITYKVMIFASI